MAAVASRGLIVGPSKSSPTCHDRRRRADDTPLLHFLDGPQTGGSVRCSPRGATEALSFTTSAVSQQIAKLEHEVGAALVERHPKGAVLTETGQALRGYADDIDRTIDAARAEMEEFAGLRRGQLRLGTFLTVGTSLMSEMVLAFRSRHEGGVTVITARREGLLKRRSAGHRTDAPKLPLATHRA
ncbi:LysR family transcriptional regulator [Arthrobacter sp. TE12232]